MYLLSTYFDKQTNQTITRYISQIAGRSGNTFMTDHHVPPHITIAFVETKQEKQLLTCFKQLQGCLSQGTLQFVSVGMFFPYVIYMTPVLNEYLQNMSDAVYETVRGVEGIRFHKFYRPMQWFPHVTLGKTLSKEEMKHAFEVMQNCFVPFEGRVTAIGLAKTKPYEELLHIAFEHEND